MVDIIYDTIILIPYRNRSSHIQEFIKSVCPVISKFKLNIKIVVVEQVEGKLFNRGKLLNVGFKEYLDKAKFIITHDVDMIPNANILKSVYVSKDDDKEIGNIIKFSTPHYASLGQVVKFSSESIKLNNGFPNNIWGWGIEDRAIYFRSVFKNINIKSSNVKKKDFKILSHKSNAAPYVGEKKNISEKWSEKYISNLNEIEKLKMVSDDGINTLDYKIINREEINESIEIIKVEI